MVAGCFAASQKCLQPCNYNTIMSDFESFLLQNFFFNSSVWLNNKLIQSASRETVYDANDLVGKLLIGTMAP